MLENYLAWHDQPIGTRQNGFAGLGHRFVFDESQGLAHLLQRIADSQDDGTFQYGGRRGDSLPLFTSGECAMWMNSSAYYAGISDQAEFDFGRHAAAAMPRADGAAELDHRRRHAVGAARPDRGEYQGVAEFFKYMSSPEVQADWHQSSGYVPITTAAYELSQEQGFYEENPGTDTAIKQLSLNEPTANSRGLRFGNFVQVRDIINEEFENLWSGNKSPRKRSPRPRARQQAAARVRGRPTTDGHVEDTRRRPGTTPGPPASSGSGPERSDRAQQDRHVPAPLAALRADRAADRDHDDLLHLAGQPGALPVACCARTPSG